jgi:hypothetical protein
LGHFGAQRSAWTRALARMSDESGGGWAAECVETVLPALRTALARGRPSDAPDAPSSAGARGPRPSGAEARGLVAALPSDGTETDDGGHGDRGDDDGGDDGGGDDDGGDDDGGDDDGGDDRRDDDRRDDDGVRYLGCYRHRTGSQIVHWHHEASTRSECAAEAARAGADWFVLQGPTDLSAPPSRLTPPRARCGFGGTFSIEGRVADARCGRRGTGSASPPMAAAYALTPARGTPTGGRRVFASRVAGQLGIDGLVRALEPALRNARDKFRVPTSAKRPFFFVDVGAHDGAHLSNSKTLEDSGLWDGICVEPFPRNFSGRRCALAAVALSGRAGERLQFVEGGALGGLVDLMPRGARRREAGRAAAGVLTEVSTSDLGEVLAGRAFKLFGETPAPRWIDFFSLDTEGSELEILRAFPFAEHDVGVWAIEHAWEQPKRSALCRLLASHGYRRVMTLHALQISSALAGSDPPSAWRHIVTEPFDDLYVHPQVLERIALLDGTGLFAAPSLIMLDCLGEDEHAAMERRLQAGETTMADEDATFAWR